MTGYVLVVVLGLIALGAIAFPLLVGRERYDGAEDLEADIARYREALEAGTVCGHCRQANPADAAYCGDCGRPLGD